jgi:hypothetical protein
VGELPHAGSHRRSRLTSPRDHAALNVFRHHGAEGFAVELTIQDVAGRAGVDVGYVRRLIDLGVVVPEGDGFRE